MIQKKHNLMIELFVVFNIEIWFRTIHSFRMMINN